MNNERCCVPLIGLFLLAGALLLNAANWPAWRGPLGTGICEETNLPIRWSKNENIKWRVSLPERGNSTPIVWNDRVFLTQAIGKERMMMCFQRSDGRLLWQRGVTNGAAGETTHETNPYCSASPVTDGERVIAWFGSDGLYCYDFSGRELWRRDLGLQRHIWGYGASPMIHGALCFLNFGPGARSFLVAVEKATGKTVWQHDEDTGYGKPLPPGAKTGDPTYIGSWTTPVFMAIAGRPQLLMTWPNRLAGYEPETGRELWTCGGINPLAYTSPIFEKDVIVAMGGFNGITIAARAGGEGDVTSTHRLWQHPRTKQRIGSGIIHAGHIYIHNDPGIAECFELGSGKLVWEERLRGPGKSGQNWSSVLYGDGNCYTINQGGDCFVFKASPKFEVVAVNSLGEPANSSIAASDGELFIRTHVALWCVSRRK